MRAWKVTGKVVEGRRHVFSGVSVGGVADDQAALAHLPVPHQHAVHPALRRRTGPPAPRARGEVPVPQEPRRDLPGSFSLTEGLRHPRGLVRPDVLRQHGSDCGRTAELLGAPKVRASGEHLLQSFSELKWTFCPQRRGAAPAAGAPDWPSPASAAVAALRGLPSR